MPYSRRRSALPVYLPVFSPEAALPIRNTVLVQMTQAKGMANKVILKEVRKTISRATAIRVLRSGDIDITVPDEAAKDRAYELPSTEQLRIYKRDYLIEVLSVPLIASENGAVNTRLVTTTKPLGPCPLAYKLQESGGCITRHDRRSRRNRRNRREKQAISRRRPEDPL